MVEIAGDLGSTDIPRPWLEVRGPDGQCWTHELTSERASVGRFDRNDIVLSPDPHRLVTGISHCTVERGESGWQLVHRGLNATWIRPGRRGGDACSK